MRECGGGRFTLPNVLTKLTSRGTRRKLSETESDKTKVKGSRIVWKVELIQQPGSNCLELLLLFHFFQKETTESVESWWTTKTWFGL